MLKYQKNTTCLSSINILLYFFLCPPVSQIEPSMVHPKSQARFGFDKLELDLAYKICEVP